MSVHKALSEFHADLLEGGMRARYEYLKRAAAKGRTE